jgi:hypothetical protein
VVPVWVLKPEFLKSRRPVDRSINHLFADVYLYSGTALALLATRKHGNRRSTHRSQLLNSTNVWGIPYSATGGGRGFDGTLDHALVI